MRLSRFINEELQEIEIRHMQRGSIAKALVLHYKTRANALDVLREKLDLYEKAEELGRKIDTEDRDYTAYCIFCLLNHYVDEAQDKISNQDNTTGDN
jgi:hypothetical protein